MRIGTRLLLAALVALLIPRASLAQEPAAEPIQADPKVEIGQLEEAVRAAKDRRAREDQVRRELRGARNAALAYSNLVAAAWQFIEAAEEDLPKSFREGGVETLIKPTMDILEMARKSTTDAEEAIERIMSPYLAAIAGEIDVTEATRLVGEARASFVHHLARARIFMKSALDAGSVVKWSPPTYRVDLHLEDVSVEAEVARRPTR